MSQLPVRKFDALVVGAGGSGMRASLQLAEAGLSVAVLSKVFPTRSHTVAAQGGIGAVARQHVARTTGSGTCTTRSRAPTGSATRTRSSTCAGWRRRSSTSSSTSACRSTATPTARSTSGPFGGHSANFGEKPVQRACAAADRTGHAMLHTLYQRNVRARTQFFVEWMALDLVRDADGDVLGVVALEMETGEVMILQAKATLFATGGAGRIFAASTNAFINTGDGLGMAARAGIPLQDMEFWQFHPTGVAGAGVLITEGVRGEGGILLNCNGERFMERYAPNREGPRVARRRLAASMDQEIKEGRGCGPEQGPRAAEARPPRPRRHPQAAAVDPRDRAQVRQRRLHQGADPGRADDPLPDGRHPDQLPRPGRRAEGRRLPSAVVHGLYAVGECACVSVHGANRLGTNSLLDLLVFGRAAGNFIVDQSLKAQGAQAAAGGCRRPARSRASRGSTARRRGESVPDVGNDAAQDDAGALRRVPQPGAARRGRAQGAWSSRSACSAPRSRTRAGRSTPRASRRSSSTT